MVLPTKNPKGVVGLADFTTLGRKVQMASSLGAGSLLCCTSNAIAVSAQGGGVAEMDAPSPMW